MSEILRMADVCQLLKVSKQTVFRWRRQGKFPHPRRATDHCVFWLKSDIDEWLRSRPESVTGKAAHRQEMGEAL